MLLIKKNNLKILKYIFLDDQNNFTSHTQKIVEKNVGNILLLWV